MKKLLVVFSLFLSVGAYAQKADSVKKHFRIDPTLTKPMYIIDGKQSDAAGFAKIKHEDIDNMSVVKDASATSIYGAAGKNGVVIVVTKAYKKQHEAKKAEAEKQGKRD